MRKKGGISHPLTSHNHPMHTRARRSFSWSLTCAEQSLLIANFGTTAARVWCSAIPALTEPLKPAHLEAAPPEEDFDSGSGAGAGVGAATVASTAAAATAALDFTGFVGSSGTAASTGASGAGVGPAAAAAAFSSSPWCSVKRCKRKSSSWSWWWWSAARWATSCCKLPNEVDKSTGIYREVQV